MLTNQNKKNGTAFERWLAFELHKHGFWAHLVAQGRDGQPVDVFAARGGHACIIDCKDCRNDYFSFERVEENQYYSMELWGETGNGEGWFALLLQEGEVWMLPFNRVARYMNIQSRMNADEIRESGTRLEDWLNEDHT